MRKPSNRLCNFILMATTKISYIPDETFCFCSMLVFVEHKPLIVLTLCSSRQSGHKTSSLSERRISLYTQSGQTKCVHGSCCLGFSKLYKHIGHFWLSSVVATDVAPKHQNDVYFQGCRRKRHRKKIR